MYRTEDIMKKKKELKEMEYNQSNIEEIMKNYGISQKAKGVKLSVVKSVITFDDYIECLDSWTSKTVSQNLIRSDQHIVHSITQTRVALSPNNDKRYLVHGSDDTLPWGHYSIGDKTKVLLDI
ncbi:unnamed protein product [Psylliodes chrysocephalus]|uniref:Uncharacterized protein n=1 Tax=Psylliodes chrysocephalus TaxID=3402493 RepID=A0A9P0D582_9CUCU|nr:unnamed protein product [Psylliodes chrysocephala]